MKKDAYYFSHDSNSKDDPKCVLLIEQLGLEGYGIFWMLVETLRDQPDYKYPLSLLAALARRYNSTAQKVETVVKNYKLFQFTEDEFFFSISLMERMEYLENYRLKKSIAGKKGNEVRWNNQLSIAESSQCDNSAITSPSQIIASKVKKSKVKKSKEKEIKDNNTIENKLLIQALNEFKEMRSKIKKPLTDRALTLTIDKLNKLAANDNEKIEILNQSIMNCYQGVFPLKKEGVNNNGNGFYKQNNEKSKGKWSDYKPGESTGSKLTESEIADLDLI